MSRWLFLLILVLGCVVVERPLVSQSRFQESWPKLKRQLSGPGGSEYFKKFVHGAMLPVLEGTLVAGAPADHPREFLVALSDDKTPEVTLKLEGHLEKPLSVGTPVTFEGVAVLFTAEPFMLTLDVETLNRSTLSARKTASPPGKNPK